MGARAKIYEVAFRIGGKMDQSFGASMLSAQKNLGLLNQQVSKLESGQKNVTRYKSLQKDIRGTETQLKSAQQAFTQYSAQMAKAPSKNLKQDLKGLETQLMDARFKVMGLAKEFDAAKKPSQTLKERLRAQRQEVKQYEKQITHLNRQIKKQDRETKTLNRGYDQAARKVENLKKKLLDQRTESARLNRAMGKAGVSTKRLAADNAALETQLNRTRAAQQKLNAVIMKQKANGRARDSKRAQLFDAVAMAGTAAFPMVFAGRFEQSMAEVKAISGATAKDFASMNQRARQLGASTSFSASEVAGGMKYLAMAGFEANEVVAAMPGLLSMARAGATDLAMSSDIASDILSGFGLKAREMNTVANVLTKTFTTSNTTLEGLGETMKYVAPVATKAGLGIEDMATMAGLLGNVGIKGSESGTALRAMILRLAAPTGEAATALANMGVEARDAEGNIRPMIDLLSEIAQESENMGSGEQLEVLKQIFGERPAASVAELIDKAGSQGITDYLKQIRAAQDTAKKTAAIMDKSLFGSVKRLASAGEGLAISIGGRLIPTFTHAVDNAVWLTGKVIALTDRFPTLTKWVGLTATGVAAMGISVIAGGYAWTVLSGGVLGAVKMFRVMQGACLLTRGQLLLLSLQQKATAIATGGLTAAQWAWNAAMTANPIGIAVAALAGGAYLVYKNWAPISDFFMDLWDKVAGFFSKAAKLARFIPGVDFGEAPEDPKTPGTEQRKIIPIYPRAPLAVPSFRESAQEDPGALPRPHVHPENVNRTIAQASPPIQVKSPEPNNVVVFPAPQVAVNIIPQTPVPPVIPPAPVDDKKEPRIQVNPVALNHKIVQLSAPPAPMVDPNMDPNMDLSGGSSDLPMPSPADGLDRMVKKLQASPAPRSSSIKISVSPVIHIAPGADAPRVKQAVNQGMAESTDRLKATMEEIFNDERRVSFG